MSRILPLILAAAVLLLACGGGDGGSDTRLPVLPGVNAPPPEARVVQGGEGWMIAVPSDPVRPGTEVRIWFNGSELEVGPRMSIGVQVEKPDGRFGVAWSTNIGAPGWTYLPITQTEQSGTYTAVVLNAETRERLVEAQFLVAED